MMVTGIMATALQGMVVARYASSFLKDTIMPCLVTYIQLSETSRQRGEGVHLPGGQRPDLCCVRGALPRQVRAQHRRHPLARHPLGWNLRLRGEEGEGGTTRGISKNHVKWCANLLLCTPTLTCWNLSVWYIFTRHEHFESESSYFSNNCYRILDHIKGIRVSFHMGYGKMICSKRLQSDRSK